MGTYKRIRRKAGEMSLGAIAELWKPKFSICELGRQVMVDDST